ncbi:Carboxymuconolactone decarboxylase family protein [Rosistilla carotiformis]|uniref:Carboxymuconolactone decarboxylase family protein n=1 Tax=Rosistilla carotiformis TaxID=2528017 RepID=A0A518JV78_9BACT|nr:carboxymuconolactone decarboxylase family protein [Rosistilla carotiformis]QDV69451.1 Carboxymuconolactone decarboxylase family protein [Rosistilla carotiformis]
MTDFNVHTIQSAPDASRPQLEQSQKAYGYVPNLHGVMAESPALLEAYRTVATIFDTKTELSATERQIIAMTNNRLNGCTYCMAAHTSIMQAANVSEDVITALRDGTSIADPKLEALRVFAEQVNTKRGWVAEDDIEALLAAGYTKQTVFEVIVGTAYKVLSNYTNHIGQTPLDEGFAKNEWNAEPQRAN